MTDTFDPKRRSEIMSAIRSRDTVPEIVVRSLIHRLGYRFRLHVQELPGTPDIVLPRLKKIVLVNGCFWHGHVGCKKSKLPKSNIEFWAEKIEKNLNRDSRNIRKLRKLGWSVLIVWQCSLKTPEMLERRIANFLTKARPVRRKTT